MKYHPFSILYLCLPCSLICVLGRLTHHKDKNNKKKKEEENDNNHMVKIILLLYKMMLMFLRFSCNFHTCLVLFERNTKNSKQKIVEVNLKKYMIPFTFDAVFIQTIQFPFNSPCLYLLWLLFGFWSTAKLFFSFYLLFLLSVVKTNTRKIQWW